MVKTTLVRCNCTSQKCRLGPLGYMEIPRSTQQRHRDADLELSLRQQSLNIVKPQKAVQIQSATDSIVGNDIVRPNSQENTENGSNPTLKTMFTSIRNELLLRQQSFSLLAESLEQLPTKTRRRGCPEALEMQAHISWMAATVSSLGTLSVTNDNGLDQQRLALKQTVQEKLEYIQHWEESCYDKLGVTDDQKYQKHGRSGDMKGQPFSNPISSSHPLIILSMMIIVVLNVMSGLSERSSNFLLLMIRNLLELAFDTCNGDREFSAERSILLKHLPKDMRTVRSRFNLEPQIQIFAACPKCSALFKPKFDSIYNSNVYPALHCNNRELDGLECGTALLKWRVSGTQTIRVPIRPFGYHSLHDFVGGLLNRPGMEDLLERRTSKTQPVTLTDIFDGSIIREFKDRDGQFCFRNNGEGANLYLAWAICVDWFNPFHNKIAGKNVSVGVISLVCLNLPLEMRNEAQNVYVAGIIPGPQEPSLHQVNSFLTPLVNEFLQSWNNGTKYSRTYKYVEGRTVVSILIPLVADLPASRKVSGTAGHGAACFCPLCLCKKKDIKDFNTSFKKRSKEEHLKLAKKWRDAKNLKQRVSLVKECGIRWSVLFELPYWETRFIVVDTMHNLFLGLVKHHFRKVIGVAYGKDRKSKNAKDQQGYEITIKTVRKILKILKDPQGPTPSRLRRHTVNDLRAFHLHQNISLPNGSLLKDDLVLSLLSCDLVKNDVTESVCDAENEENEQLNVVDQDALPFCLLDDASNSVSDDVERTVINSSLAHFRPRANPVAPKISLGSQEIDAIQEAIQSTSRPSWQQGPPKALGTGQQGKIKADQWRTLIEFDLPVALVELWVESDKPITDMDAMRRNHLLSLVDITMELAIAVFWGTSRRTSFDHALNYIFHMQKYLQGLKELQSKPKLVPNHHAALHVAEQLLFFGPVHGWWTFPYERLIGALQKFTINHCISEIELTMMKSYYANAHLKQFLRADECPKVLTDHLSPMGKYFLGHTCVSNASEDQISRKSIKDDGRKAQSIEPLDDDIYDVVCFLARQSGLDQLPNRKFFVHRSHYLDGIKFTSIESERDSVIFYGGSAQRVPGVIRKIFSLPSGEVIFAVHPYLKLDDGVSDPFTQWPEFRASLWSQRIDEQVQLINPQNTYICHAARRPWKHKEVYVLRALDRNY